MCNNIIEEGDKPPKKVEGKTMTKAERIYQKTRWMCKNSMETFGYEENKDGKAVGYNFVASEDEGVVYEETLKAMEKLLEGKRKMIEMDKKLGIIDEQQYTKEKQLSKMIESTILNTRESISKRY